MAVPSKDKEVSTQKHQVDNDENAPPLPVFRVLALYKFTPVPAEEIPQLQKTIEELLRASNASGSILLAEEGINGTICYPLQHFSDFKDDESTNDNENKKFAKTQDNEANDPILQYLKHNKYFHGLRTRISNSPYNTFHRLKVKIKQEICTLGEVTFDNNNTSCSTSLSCEKNTILSPCNAQVGKHVSPQEWNKLLLDPEIAVIDTRNGYEINLGTFQNAISPQTDNFKQFPSWLQNFAKRYQTKDEVSNSPTEDDDKNNDQQHLYPKKLKGVAMFCTGGIRCEKATAYALQSKMFQKASKSTDKIQPNATNENANVVTADVNNDFEYTSTEECPIYHLDGGILAYLQQTPPSESLFNGDCYVFDQRVSVHGPDLKPGQNASCHGCRKPLTPLDLLHPDYVEGIMCHYCANSIRMNERKMKRLKERQLQIEIAQERGKVHIHDPKRLDN